MNTIENIQAFPPSIGIECKNFTYYRTAFTHRSYLNEVKKDPKSGETLEHNERMEFLGDAVLEMAATEYLYAKYPKSTEGELTAVRAAIVNTVSISEAGKRLGMNEYLLLSKGESKDTGRARDVILANAFEAFIGAVFLDHGYQKAQEFIATSLFAAVDGIVEKKLWVDPKSRFQELVQERHNVTPTYRIVKEEGPDHNKFFISGAFVDDVKVAEGAGKSKQEAEAAAARKALESME